MRWLLGIVVAVAALGAGAAPAAAARPVVVAFADASPTVAESATSIQVVLQRSGNGRSTVEVSPAGGTASGATACATGVDYVLKPTSKVTFTGNSRTARVTLALCPDATDEPDETILLLLGNPSKGTRIGALNQTMVVISDDDADAGCVDDAVSDDTLETATAMAHDVTYQRVSCPGNSDWFAVERVQRMHITKTGAFDLIIYDSEGQIAGYLDWQVQTTVDMPIPFPESFSFEAVQPFPSGSPYTLRVNISLPLPTTG